MEISQERLLLTVPTNRKAAHRTYNATNQEEPDQGQSSNGGQGERSGEGDGNGWIYSPDDGDEGHISVHEEQEARERSVTLCWHQIKATVKVTRSDMGWFSCMDERQEPIVRTLLHDVSGIVKAGSFLVIMGASGSGKTTLLNCLTGRNLGTLKVTGDVLVNGKAMGEEINTISSYAQQDDMFMSSMTVREHLQFHAVLRMGDTLVKEDRNKRIEEVMTELGIVDCQNTVIGEPGLTKGLSGGERKRLSFACELLTNPSVMFCDEPTSGLDSFTAQSVVQSLKNQTARGRTILCTIHQPSSNVFAMFDEILVMAEGRVAYMGPTDELTPFLSSLGYMCPTSYNPADYVIQTLAIIPEHERDCRLAIMRISDSFEGSNHAASIRDLVQEQQQLGQQGPTPDVETVEKTSFAEELNILKKKALSQSEIRCKWLTQFRMCLWRSFLGVTRKTGVLPMLLGAALSSNILLGVIYWQQPNTSSGVSNLDASMFLLMLQVPFTGSMPVAVALCREIPIFHRENQNRLYSVSAYYLGKVIMDIAVITMASILCETVVYWMIGFYPGIVAFTIAVMASMLIAQIGVAYGHFSACVFPNPQMALVLLPAILGSTLIFTGFLVRDASINWLFKPIAWISAFRYTYMALLTNQWRDVGSIDCDIEYESGNATHSAVGSAPWCFPNGQAIIASYEYETEFLPFCFVINLSLLIATELLGYIVLRVKSRPR